MTVRRLSAEARADLADLLRGSDAASGLEALEAAVADYGRAVDARAAEDAEMRRLRQGLTTLRRRLQGALTALDALEADSTAEWLRFAPCAPRTRAALRATLVQSLDAATENFALLRQRPGPKRRMALNGGIARALLDAGVELTKSRASITGRVFACIYADLSLSTSGDVFEAIAEGVTLVTREIYIPRKVRRKIRAYLRRE